MLHLLEVTNYRFVQVVLFLALVECKWTNCAKIEKLIGQQQTSPQLRCLWPWIAPRVCKNIREDPEMRMLTLKGQISGLLRRSGWASCYLSYPELNFRRFLSHQLKIQYFSHIAVNLISSDLSYQLKKTSHFSSISQMTEKNVDPSLNLSYQLIPIQTLF